MCGSRSCLNSSRCLPSAGFCADWMLAACEQDEELIELFGDGKGGPGSVTAVRVVRDAKTSVGKVSACTSLCSKYRGPAVRVQCFEGFCVALYQGAAIENTRPAATRCACRFHCEKLLVNFCLCIVRRDCVSSWHSETCLPSGTAYLDFTAVFLGRASRLWSFRGGRLREWQCRPMGACCAGGRSASPALPNLARLLPPRPRPRPLGGPACAHLSAEVSLCSNDDP